MVGIYSVHPWGWIRPMIMQDPFLGLQVRLNSVEVDDNPSNLNPHQNIHQQHIPQPWQIAG